MQPQLNLVDKRQALWQTDPSNWSNIAGLQENGEEQRSVSWALISPCWWRRFGVFSLFKDQVVDAERTIRRRPGCCGVGDQLGSARLPPQLVCKIWEAKQIRSRTRAAAASRMEAGLRPSFIRRRAEWRRRRGWKGEEGRRKVTWVAASVGGGRFADGGDAWRAICNCCVGRPSRGWALAAMAFVATGRWAMAASAQWAS